MQDAKPNQSAIGLTPRQRWVAFALGTVALNAIVNPSIEKWADQEGVLRRGVSVLEAISGFLSSDYVVGAVAFTAVLFLGPPVYRWLVSFLDLPLWMLGQGGRKSLVPNKTSLWLIRSETGAAAVGINVEMTNVERPPLYLKVTQASAEINGVAFEPACKTPSVIMSNERQSLLFSPVSISDAGGKMTGSVRATVEFGISEHRLTRVVKFDFSFEMERHRLPTAAPDVHIVEDYPQVRTSLVYLDKKQVKT
jgi:hypothetical protein